MNRHDAVADITRDHAVQAEHGKRLEASTRATPQDALKAARAYLEYHRASILPHFEEEELHLVPLAPGSVQGRFNRSEELVRNATDELRITLMDPSFFRAAILHVGAALREHVAFCESNLIPEVAYNSTPEAFEALGQRMRAFRQRVRPGGVGETRTEPTGL